MHIKRTCSLFYIYHIALRYRIIIIIIIALRSTHYLLHGTFLLYIVLYHTELHFRFQSRNRIKLYLNLIIIYTYIIIKN